MYVYRKNPFCSLTIFCSHFVKGFLTIRRGKNHPKRFDQEVKDGKEPSMAKMLKRLGIGSKKGSNNPTKSEYSGHKSNSVQDLFGKAGSTCKHGYPNTLSSSSSNIHGHHSFDYTESQRHSRSLRKNGPSRASSEKHSHCRSTCEYSSNDSRTETSNPTPVSALLMFKMRFYVKFAFQNFVARTPLKNMPFLVYVLNFCSYLQSRLLFILTAKTSV